MKEDVLLSFVVVNRNGQDILPRCLRSVFSQELEGPFEVIVVDDASTDGSVDLVRKAFPEARLLVQRRNKGPAAAKRAGAALARGKYIAFLDNDVVLERGWARAMVHALASYPEAGAAASHMLLDGPGGYLNSTGGLVNLLGYAWERGVFLPDSRTYCLNREVTYACSAAMAVRRDVYQLAGGFDPRYFYLYEDVDLGWRINALGFRVVYVPEARAHHLLSATMGSQGNFKVEYLSVRNRFYTLLKNTERETLRLIIKEALYRVFHDGGYYDYGNGGNRALKIRVPLRVLIWNLVALPWIMRSRRWMKRARRMSDSELMERGVFLPNLSFPDIGTDPRPTEACMHRRTSGRVPKRLMAGKGKGEGLVYGWYGPEESAKGIPFRWTAERAAFELSWRRGRDALFLITLGGHPQEGSAVEVWVNGYRLGELRVVNQLEVHRIPVPREIMGDDERSRIQVELRVLNPFVPSLQGEGMDGRSLGMGLVAAGSTRLGEGLPVARKKGA